MNGTDGLTVPVHPAALFGIGFALAFVCYALVPWSFWPDRLVLRLAVGMSLLAAGFGVVLWALRALRGRQQAPEFGRPVTALVEAGPYGRSRNPMYAGVLMGYLGFAAVLGDLWYVAWAVGVAIALHRFVVVREESYLRARFGCEYEAYARRVRPWL